MFEFANQQFPINVKPSFALFQNSYTRLIDDRIEWAENRGVYKYENAKETVG